MKIKYFVIMFISTWAFIAQASDMAGVTRAAVDMCKKYEQERALLFSPGDITPRDVTEEATANSVTYIEAPVRNACMSGEAFVLAHCHQIKDKLTPFPSISIGNSGDIIHAFDTTKRCAKWAAEVGREPPDIQFAVVDAPGERLVFFNISEEYIQRAKELGIARFIMDQKIDEFSKSLESSEAEFDVLVDEIIELHIQEHYAMLSSEDEYVLAWDDYMAEKCTFIDALFECEGTSVEEFAERSYRQGLGFVLEPYDNQGNLSVSLVRGL